MKCEKARQHWLWYHLCFVTFVSFDGLVQKLQKLSAEAQKGMTRRNYLVWMRFLRDEIYHIPNPEIRVRALQLLRAMECCGFCLERAMDVREDLLVPAIERMIVFLNENGRKKPQEIQTGQCINPS
jgi:hypothetical protein